MISCFSFFRVYGAWRRYHGHSLVRQMCASILGAMLLALTASFATVAAKQTTEPLSITTANGTHRFDVDVMRTEPELERGLMFRKSIPASYGMLFDFKQEQSVAMWMKNTFVPLDMIFIAKSGRVVGIVANARPMSEQILTVAAPTDAVLEVNAGTAAKIGLKVGDIVHHPIFTP